MTDLVYPKNVTLVISGTTTGDNTTLNLQVQKADIGEITRAFAHENVLGGAQFEKVGFPSPAEITFDIVSDDDTFEQIMWGAAAITSGGYVASLTGSAFVTSATASEVKGEVQLRYADSTGSIVKAIVMKNAHMTGISYAANVDDGGGKGTFKASCTVIDGTGSANFLVFERSGTDYLIV